MMQGETRMNYARRLFGVTVCLVLTGVMAQQAPSAVGTGKAAASDAASMAGTAVRRVTVDAVRSRGIAYMMGCQSREDGSWMGMFGHPAITALAVVGIYGTPEYRASAEIRTGIDRALDYIIKNAQADGSIFSGRRGGRGGGKGGAQDSAGRGAKGLQKRGGRAGAGGAPGAGGYAVYNTSICLLALATVNRPQDMEVMRKARAYLMGSDAIPKTGDGGFGYGGQTRSDLNNTAWALEALHATDFLSREPFSTDAGDVRASELAWDNALQFVTLCQNLKDTNQSAWVASAPEGDKGGFIYCPQEAMKDNPEARSLRSYGTMTYSGLKSLIYAKVKPDDVRMKSALEWVLRNYSLDENPGVGKSGLFYYYHTFSKTLALMKLDSVTDARGVRHDWRAELIGKLASIQRPDGSWSNEESGRWMESIPQLATAYSLMAIQQLSVGGR